MIVLNLLLFGGLVFGFWAGWKLRGKKDNFHWPFWRKK